LRKQIQTHKLGENGFKPGADGSYWNALENHNEAFKFIEDAIAAVGLNVTYFSHFFRPTNGSI
jgi:hypothetical protein